MKFNDSKTCAENIRYNYVPKENTKFDDLRKLDNAVKRPAKILAYVVGIVGALCLGIGMSLVMTDLPAFLGISDPMLLGIVVGVVGIALCSAVYPLYKSLLGLRRKKYADRVLKLADQIAEN